MSGLPGGSRQVDPLDPTPDDKDWTWVLDRPCRECGFAATAMPGDRVAAALPGWVDRWRQVLARPDARERPSGLVWSPLEYGCHVRDVLVVFGDRAASMLASDDPAFANWDQDATAIQGRYHAQDPTEVADDLAGAAAATGAVFAAVPDGGWVRPGRRSNGSVFTLDSLARYFAHDVVHHLHDVSG